MARADGLTAEEIQEAQTPAWAKESVPAEFQRFLGKAGLSAPWNARPGPLGKKVLGIDRWQANHFIVCRPETEAFLYGPYSPPVIHYRPGLLPSIERLAETCGGRLSTATDKAAAFVTRALPERLPHPTVPPIGSGCGPDRALDDEGLLASGCAFCNEQARVFIRLCQASGIPARLVFLFYADGATGHTTAEFWTGAKWAMVDVSWYCLFPGRDGALMSAAECHGDSINRGLMARAYHDRMKAILDLPDEALAGLAVPASTPERAAAIRARANELRGYVRERLDMAALARHLDQFGLENYPLPDWGSRLGESGRLA